jgi:DNA-binding response OmpR family regulator
MNIACCIRDPFLGSELPELLVREGLDYELFRHESALMRALRHRGAIDLALIEMGPDATAEESVLSWLHCRFGETVPVILLSSRWTADRVAVALGAGADDCMSKPVETVELVARMKAVLRRSGGPSPQRARVELGGFVLDKNLGTLADRGVAVDLTPREFALAWLFFVNPGMRLTRESISAAVWGLDKDIAGRTIEQHIYKLRKKIGLDESRGVSLRTAYGQGYRLEVVAAASRREVVGGLSRLSQMDARRQADAA